MPQTTKNAKKQQEKATHAQSIKLHQFRLAPPHSKCRSLLHFDCKSRRQTLWVTRVRLGLGFWVMPVGLVLNWWLNVKSKVKV